MPRVTAAFIGGPLAGEIRALENPEAELLIFRAPEVRISPSVNLETHVLRVETGRYRRTGRNPQSLRYEWQGWDE